MARRLLAVAAVVSLTTGLATGLATPAAAATATPTPDAPAPAAAAALDREALLDEQIAAQAEVQAEIQAEAQAASGVRPDTRVDPVAAAGLSEVPLASAAGGFDPGLIISDANFFDGGRLDEAEVQTFLNAQVPRCDPGYTCLKDYRQTSTSQPADAMCAAYQGVANETSAAIIAKVGRACGVSQAVLLVLLQKEQSLVTDTWPSARQYRSATGYGCPDTADCDADYYGFFNQVYNAAWQYKRYSNPPGTTKRFTWFPVGAVSSIGFNPDASCGSAPVTIRNQATAGLYYYTPYQPNAALLAGRPDGCSAYGNFNFVKLYTGWFGDPVGSSGPVGAVDAVSVSGASVTVRGWALDVTTRSSSVLVDVYVRAPDGSERARSVTASVSRPDVDVVFPGAGAAHGYEVSIPIEAAGSHRVCVIAHAVPWGSVPLSSLGCAMSPLYSPAVNGTPATDRLSGADRAATSVTLSRSAFAGTAPVVYVASGDGFADSLGAAAAAAHAGGPLLLSGRDDVSAAVLDEIRRLRPASIVLVGGESAVSRAVEVRLGGLGATVTRVGGADRYATSAAVVDHAFPGRLRSAYLATGVSFPDALVAAAAAGSKDVPVILVPGGDSSAPTASEVLARHRVRSVTVVGGPAAVGAPLADGLAASGLTVRRLAGADRFSTAAAINADAFPTAGEAYLATGLDFADALAAAAVAGGRGLPVHLGRGDCVDAPVLAELARATSARVHLVGGTAALAPPVERLVGCL